MRLLRSRGDRLETDDHGKGGNRVDLLWIILIVILVLALLGFFTRGRW